MDVERENADLRVQLSELETNCAGKDGEIVKLRRKLQNVERQNEALQHSNAIYQRERLQLEQEVVDSSCFTPEPRKTIGVMPPVCLFVTVVVRNGSEPVE